MWAGGNGCSLCPAAAPALGTVRVTGVRHLLCPARCSGNPCGWLRTPELVHTRTGSPWAGRSPCFKGAFFRLWDTRKMLASGGADVRGARAGFFSVWFFPFHLGWCVFVFTAGSRRLLLCCVAEEPPGSVASVGFQPRFNEQRLKRKVIGCNSGLLGSLLSSLADKPTPGFRLLVLPVFLHSGWEFRRREIRICCVIFQPFFFFFFAALSALLVGCKHSSGGRERALLKPPSEDKASFRQPEDFYLLFVAARSAFSMLCPRLGARASICWDRGFALGGGRNDRELFWAGWLWAASCWRWGSAFSFIPAERSRSHQL